MNFSASESRRAPEKSQEPSAGRVVPTHLQIILVNSVNRVNSGEIRETKGHFLVRRQPVASRRAGWAQRHPPTRSTAHL